MKIIEGVAGGGAQGGFVQEMEGKAMEYAAKQAMEGAVQGEMKKLMGEVRLPQPSRTLSRNLS